MKIPPGIYPQNGKHGTTYKVKWRDVQGKQHSQTLRTLSEAKRVNTRIRADRDKGLGGPAGLNMEFKEVAIMWATNMTHHRPSTARRRDGVIHKHLIPAFDGMKLIRVTSLAVDQATTSWQAAGLSAHTIRTHLQILNQIMRYAIRKDLIVKNPVEGAERPKLPKSDIRTISEREFQLLLEHTEPHYRLLLSTAAVTGFRWGELAALTVADLEGSALRVREGKTASAARVVPISDLLEHRIRNSFASDADPTSPMFRTKSGAALEYQNFIRRVFNPALKSAGLTNITFHDLRRTRASMLVHSGIDPKTVQVLMGHDSIETTLKYYVNDSKDAALLAAAIGQQYLDRAAQPDAAIE